MKISKYVFNWIAFSLQWDKDKYCLVWIHGIIIFNFFDEVNIQKKNEKIDYLIENHKIYIQNQWNLKFTTQLNTKFVLYKYRMWCNNFQILEQDQ